MARAKKPLEKRPLKPIPKVERGNARIADLQRAAYNPRRMDDDARAGLSASLERFGLVQDVIVNRRTMTIVGGHQRVDIAEEHGETEVPVTWVDLDEHAEKALNVTLNNGAIQGHFDDDKLDSLLGELREVDVDFDELRLDELLTDDAPSDDDETDDDEGGGKAPRTPSGKKVIALNGEQWEVFAKALARLAQGGPLEHGEAIAELAERYLASVKGKP